MGYIDFAKPLPHADIIVNVEQIKDIHSTLPEDHPRATLSQDKFYFSKMILCDQSEYFKSAINFWATNNPHPTATCELSIKITQNVMIFNIILNRLWHETHMHINKEDFIDLWKLSDFLIIESIKDKMINDFTSGSDLSLICRISICYTLMQQYEPFKEHFEAIFDSYDKRMRHIKFVPDSYAEYVLNTFSVHQHLACLLMMVHIKPENIQYHANILQRIDKYGIEKFLTESKYEDLQDFCKVVHLLKPKVPDKYLKLIFAKLATSTSSRHHTYYLNY